MGDSFQGWVSGSVINLTEEKGFISLHMPSPFRSVRHLHRYSEIARVFIRHGFGFAFTLAEPGPGAS
jgi:hypothetical protein